MQHDRSPDDMRAESWIPTQRTGPAAQVPTGPTAPIPVVKPPTVATNQQPPASPVSPGRPAPVSPGQPAPISPRPPTAPASDETMVLPVFVTGKKPERSPVRQAVADTKLPSSERGMLVFVAALLAVGTIAVVAMMGFGLAGGTSAVPKRTPSPVPSTAAGTPAASSAPTTSPTPSPPAASPSASAKPSASKSPRHSASPSPVSLGTLSNNAVRSYCWSVNHGTPVPPQDGGSWTCVAGADKQQKFSPTTVCRTTFNDKSAYASVGKINDPATWRCLT